MREKERQDRERQAYRQKQKEVKKLRKEKRINDGIQCSEGIREMKNQRMRVCDGKM